MQESDDMEKLIEELRRQFFLGREVLNGVKQKFWLRFDFVGYKLAAILQQLGGGYYLSEKIPG